MIFSSDQPISRKPIITFACSFWFILSPPCILFTAFTLYKILVPYIITVLYCRCKVLFSCQGAC
nr:MAG TPA: hypothetical protein [Caudoviricetes sp.]